MRFLLELRIEEDLTQRVTSGGTTTTVTSGIIEFMYSASGVKLRKTVIPYDLGGAPLPAIVTNYSNGAEYDGNNSLVRLQNTEGAIALQPAGTYQYEYVLKDHLGNARVTFRDDANSDTNSPLGVVKVEEIVQINHYYPYGLNMEGNWNGASANAKNKYQYNSKELNTDFGLNWNDFGFRWYDPTIGRFPSIDPIIEKFSYLTPYNYASNSPVKNIDLWGLQGVNTNTGKTECNCTENQPQNRVSTPVFDPSVLVQPTDEAKTNKISVPVFDPSVLFQPTNEVRSGQQPKQEQKPDVDTKEENNNDKTLFRGMQRGDLPLLPLIGESARTLGVRPNQDIPVDNLGNVHPKTGGMSVAPDEILNLPIHRRPPGYMGTGRDPVWQIKASQLPFGLIYRQDTPTHGLIEPAFKMSYQQYVIYLVSTQFSWKDKGGDTKKP